MNKSNVQELEKLLDQRYAIALDTDEEMGHTKDSAFFPSNPDYIYHTGMIAAIEALGFDWERTLDWKTAQCKHKLFK